MSDSVGINQEHLDEVWEMADSQQVQIRVACQEDIPSVLGLLRHLWPDKAINETALSNVLSRGMKSGDNVYLCAENSDGMVGFCSMQLHDSLWQESLIAYVETLIVAGKSRGQGIGTRMLDEVIEMARLRECRKIELDSAFHRESAHDFYESHGFQKRAFVFSKDL